MATTPDPFTIRGWEVYSRIHGVPTYCPECDEETPHQIRWCKRHLRWALICAECATHSGDVQAEDDQGNVAAWLP